MSTRIQVAIAWSVPVSVVVLFLGFGPIGGFIPPPHANDTAEEIASFYRDDTTGIRLGLFLTFLSVMFWGPLVGAISHQLARIEGDRPLFARIQLVAGAAAWIFLTLPLLILSAAAFRPDRSVEITQTIHDLGWITLFMPVVPFFVQAVTIGVAILRDTAATPVLPRWMGYLNLWCAFLFMPGVLLTFFKTGPFSYHGLLVYWVPFGVFGIWLLALAWAVRHAAVDEAQAAAREPVAA
jgi:hypothetical protein